MMWMIPISILTTCLTALALTAMSWIRRDLRSQLEACHETNQEITTAYTSLTRTLLGVASDSAPPTETTSTLWKPPEWQEPEAEFGSLPIDGDLLREYEEHLQTNGTLSGKHARANPLVEQIVPGQVRLNTTG